MERLNGFDAAAKEITLSPQLIDKLPRNVRAWSCEDVILWLEDIFKDSEFLPGYVENFRRFGVSGVDILAAEVKELEQLGIVNSAHVKRAQIYISQLVRLQKRLDDELGSGLGKGEAYYDLLKEYNSLISQDPPYQPPRNMELWKAIDVFYFLNMKGDFQDTLSMFVVPMAMKRITGLELIDIIKSPDETLDLPGLSCDKRDIKRLKDATLKYKTQMDNKEKFMKEARYRELRLGLKTFDRNRVNISQILDSGFYGVVYRVEYDNKSWALKILREASSKPDHKIAAGKDKKGSDEQKELSPHADDLLYEAAMLHRAAGSGVIQLRAVDVNHETPCMLTEYMCFLSVEKEFQAVDERNDETSIFHPNNPNNVHEREHKLVEDPILLQMVRISRDVATALARIHAKGIIHLDISARNIFLDASKRPKIGDFGCATMECDMKEQYEWRKKKLDAGDYTTSDTGEFLYDTEVEMEKLSLSDDSAIRKFKMSMMDRPVRYMPHWVVNCGSPPNPLIDSHCDVYAFGCFMYEMVTHKPPHAELTNKDVIHSKKLGEGNPVIPPGIHDEYKSIMSQCWEPYDSQPTMMQVAQRLHAFHNELATKSFKIDEFYDEMRAEPMEPGAAKESVYASVTDAVAAIDPGVSLPSTGKQNTKPPPVGKDKPNIADDYVYLHFPSTVESRFVEKFIQYDGIEVPLEKLQAAVSSAFTHLDHEFIAGILECIVLEPRRAPVGLACDCLTYIAKLARDEHGSTDVGDQWHRLCAVIVRVVKYAQQKLPVQDQGKVLQNSFAAAAGLALSKYLSDDSSGTIVMEQLCNMTVSVLELHRTDARLVENAADLIASLAAVSPTILSYLQEHMAIGLLLDAMQAHSGDDMVLVASVKAIGKFPLVYLINPRNTKANMVADEKQSNVLDKTDMYCKMYSEVLCGIMASIARFDEDSCERSSNEEMLLKTCLLTIFKRCLAEENDLDLLERFFFGTQLQHIAFLVALLNIFPDDFNIQNGAIGILSLMLITGSRITVEETSAETEKVDQSSSEKHTKGTNTTTVVSIVKALTPAARRLEVLLERDVGLKFILRSMERFPINDTVHDIFKSMAEDGIIEQDVVITMSRGVYHGGRNAKTRTRTTETNEQYSTAADDLRAAYEAGKEEALVLQKDSNGELITAAPLQASIVLILGIACNSRKDIQVNLLRTRYNEGILYAFRNFSDDPRLIQYGCHAIYSTARCNTLHQKILYELHILKHLFGALNSYSVGVGSAWKVIDGVICALIGLLEPVEGPNEDLIKLMTTAEKERVEEDLVLEHKNNRCIAVMDEITTECVPHDLGKRGSSLAAAVTTTGKKRSLVQALGVMVVDFILSPECYQILANYYKLLNCIIFWKTRQEQQLKEELKQKTRLELKKVDIKNPELLATWRTKFIEFDSADEMNFLRKLQRKYQRAKGRHDVIALANSTKEMTSDAKKIAVKNTTEQLQNETTDLFEAYVSMSNHVPLLQYILLPLVVHRSEKHVLEAHVLSNVFSILTAIIGEHCKTLPNYSVGDPIPFGSPEGAQLLSIRNTFVTRGMAAWTVEVFRRREKDAVLIRYNLWLMLFFICEKSKYGQDLATLKNVDKAPLTAEGVASDFAINGAIEWAVEVLKKYHDCYSLQCLASMFLIWMEYHGRFSNRSVDRLEDLRSVLLRILSTRICAYRTLDEEGYDTNMMGQTRLVFGQLSKHADRLLRRVEFHLSEHLPKRSDARCHLVSVKVEQIETEEDSRTHRACSVYVIKVIWNKDRSDKPLSAPLEPVPQRILSTSRRARQNSTDPMESDQRQLKWRISRRFNMFRLLRKELLKKFAHLVPFEDINDEDSAFSKAQLTLGNRFWAFFYRTITPEFLENRRVRLQRWIEKVMALRASTYSTPFLEFLDIPIHTKDRLKSPKILPEIRDDKLFPVHSICYDVISRLLIIGSGVVRPKRFMLSSKPKVLGPRGKVMVYDCEFYLSTCTTNALCETLFTTCVTAVAWDSSRNIVFVGLSSGPIVLMCLSDDKKELTYLGELDYNSDIICNLVVETYNDTFLAASRSGALFSYDLVEGQILSKATWGGARFTALAYDSRDETSFCGTTIGAFFVFDLLINPPVLLHKVILDATVATNESTSVGEITGLHFEESSRLLYVALREHIYIYRILDKVDNSPPTLWCKLSVNEKAQINNLLVLLHGRYVVAGCVNGGVAVFDMANRPDDINGVYDVITAESDMFLQGTAVDSLMLHCCEQPEVSPELFKPPADHCDDSSISLQLLPWVQVIHGSNISMRNWLRACGVEADPKACRADLIRCVADVMGADARTVAEFLMPSNPQKDVKLAWKFNSTVCSSVYVEDLRAVMFGCTDGTIQIVSLADFLAPLSEFEDQEIMDRRLSPPQRLVLDGEFSRTTRGKGQIIDKCSPDFVDSGEHDEPLTAEERESVFFNNVMAVTDETDEPEPEADRYS